ncbi:MAG: holo-ACP synthase [Deltaproteobacteria bacterium]|nr:holo-ACP synthase [Deltaproteobacteria bacterium]
MSIFGIGSDIVEVSRIEHLITTSGDRFLKRIYSSAEITYAMAKARPALHFAARFAAKEAFVKALGCGFRDGIEWRDIEIENNRLGRPSMRLHNRVAAICRQYDLLEPWLTLAHEQEYAQAFVILESDAGKNPATQTGISAHE